jgi:hypothetical protein
VTSVDETGQVTVRVLCVLGQVCADGPRLRHVHGALCDSQRFIIRTDRYVDRAEAHAAAVQESRTG